MFSRHHNPRCRWFACSFVDQAGAVGRRKTVDTNLKRGPWINENWWTTAVFGLTMGVKSNEKRGRQHTPTRQYSRHFSNFSRLPPDRVKTEFVCPGWIFLLPTPPHDHVIRATNPNSAKTTWWSELVNDGSIERLSRKRRWSVWLTRGETVFYKKHITVVFFSIYFDIFLSTDRGNFVSVYTCRR